MEGYVDPPKSEDVIRVKCEIPRSKYKLACPECGLLFVRSDNSLQVHATRRHPEKLDQIMKLAYSEQVVSKPNQILQDLHPGSAEDRFECKHCGVEYKSLGALANHIVQTKCVVCKGQFRCPLQLKWHLQRHHKSYINNSHLKKSHGHLIGARTKTLCEICGQLVSNVKAHLITHQSEKPFKCESCPKSFKSRFKCQEHFKIVHLKIVNEFPCEACGKVFHKKTHLASHKLVHETEKRFQCNYPNCEYKTRYKYNLNVHVKKHTGEIK